ncbi:GEVED domain-containing protein, partial [Flavobacteriales bacterium]|nr:GEVED domain-containing protein [Flavobacteriales bacterium]
MRKILLSLIAVLFINSSAYCQTNLTVPTINATDVILSWDDGGCSQGNYILRYREDGAAWNQNPSITIPNTGGSQTYSLSGINISTTYNWRMKCGNGGSWVNGPDFTTLSTPPCDGPYVIPPPANIAGLNYLGTYNGSYYYESISTGYDWNSANSICISHGGNLAIITDMSENDSLHNWTTNSYNWIGLYQNLSSSNYIENNGGWEWVDGNTLSYINGGWIGFQNWDNNQPDNAGTGGSAPDAHHGLMQTDGSWDDFEGNAQKGFIMEVSRITQTITDFSPDPLTGYLQWSYDTLIITNTSSCDINIRPEFIISHPTSAITATDLLIQWESPLGWNVGTIPYQIDGNGDAYGFWGFPSNDSTGYILTAGLSQLMKIRVHFKNPSQSPPNGAPFGTYTADWTTYQVDSLGNILQTLAPSSSVSLTLSDCSNYSVIDSISTNNVSCNGLSDGDAEVALNSTGSGNYSFLWSNGQTAGSIGNLTAGTYTVIVTDIGLGCVDSMTTIITDPNLPSVSLIGTHITCNGADDGILNASVGGGSGQFDFIWTPSLPNQANQANLPPDAYSLNVVDLLCGDIASASYTITEPALLSSSIINPTDNTSCNPIICNGSFGLTLSGGTQPYVYSWASSSNTDSLRTDLCAGTYTITASDANSCNTFIESGTIADNPFSPYACVTGNDISCAGLTDGSAQASISTGGCGTISSLSYCASSPGTNDYANIELVRIIGDGDSIVNNTSGICDTYEDYTNQYTTLTPGQTYSITVNLGSCNPVGGTVDSAGIFIDWNLNGDFTDSGEKIAVFSGVPSPSINTISITVPNTAALGPTRMRIVSQAQINNQFYPDGPVSACAVGNFGTTYNQPWYGATEDYSIVISGSIPATYIWSNGDTTPSISGLSAGTYSCILTDLNGCSSTNSVIISEPSSILVAENTTDVSCSGYSDGTATLSISGGTPPYSENWNGNDSSALAVGVYYYTITDSAGCIYTDSVSISGPSP